MLLVDPSLFTAPYDAALSAGLEANGLKPCWATRGLRSGEEDDLGLSRRASFFYPLSDGARRRTGGPWRAIKGLEHALGLRSLVRRTREGAFDLVHYQWALLPALDLRAIRSLRRTRPVVMTVHDTTPFNGKDVPRAQRDGFGAVLRAVDRLIVHTARGRDALIAEGIDAGRIAVVPHGLLAGATTRADTRADGRWRIVQFGKIQRYKGVDVLIEALGLLAADDRARMQVIVAGEPMIDMVPLVARAEALGLASGTLEFRLHRHLQAAMDAVLAEADAFVFPYRVIDASGVLLLVAAANKWMVASDLGSFAELIGTDGGAGALVPPGDAAALAAALVGSIGRRPTRSAGAGVPDWTQIGAMTLAVYEDAAAAWSAERARPA